MGVNDNQKHEILRIVPEHLKRRLNVYSDVDSVTK